MSDAAEKVVEASPEKKKRARRKGDVPVSAEANTAASLAGFLIGVPIAAAGLPTLFRNIGAVILRPEDTARALLTSDAGAGLLVTALLFLIPLALLPAAAVIGMLFIQQGIVVAPDRIKPDLKKISPIAGVGRKFGPQALLEFVKNAAKVVILTATGSVLIFIELQRLASAFALNPIALPPLLLRELVIFLGAAFAVSALFAFADWPLVRAQREKRLRMSTQEAREETKENEGDAQVKSQRRKRAEKIAMTRMLSETRTADVLVTNPTHYAVALRWERDGLHLPRCVAKGTDDLALRLRMVARDAGVPVREDPPTARELFASIDVGDTIRQEHFAAVAAAIRFADRVRAN